MTAGNRLSDPYANYLLDQILSGYAYTWPATWYFALLTTAPTDDTGAGAVEVTGGSYARVGMAANTTNFPTAVARSKANAVVIQWPTATADWAPGATKIVGIGLYNAGTSGTYCGYGALGTSVNVLTGGAPMFAIGAFTMTA